MTHRHPDQKWREVKQATSQNQQILRLVFARSTSNLTHTGTPDLQKPAQDLSLAFAPDLLHTPALANTPAQDMRLALACFSQELKHASARDPIDLAVVEYTPLCLGRGE